MENTKFTYEDAVQKIESIGGKPIVVEAQWDGDTHGWYLMMFIIIKKGIFRRNETHHLGNISMGGDIRIFQGTVPPYPESELAQEIGNKLKEKYNIEFFFPSPIKPDNNCPRWEEKELAINCADCDKLIIPTDSPYLPKDICYSCHLERERIERIKNEEPVEGGANLYLYKKEEYISLGYASKFESMKISQFVDFQLEKLDTSSIQILTLESEEIKKMILNLETEIDKQIQEYEKPEMNKSMERFVQVLSKEYKSKKYELMQRFNPHHENLLKLFYTLETAKKAFNGGYQYKIYFKNGFTYRDDSILRFINFKQGGQFTFQDIVERYNKILSEEEVLLTINKLKDVGCLTINHDTIIISQQGKNIL